MISSYDLFLEFQNLNSGVAEIIDHFGRPQPERFLCDIDEEDLHYTTVHLYHPEEINLDNVEVKVIPYGGYAKNLKLESEKILVTQNKNGIVFIGIYLPSWKEITSAFGLREDSDGLTLVFFIHIEKKIHQFLIRYINAQSEEIRKACDLLTKINQCTALTPPEDITTDLMKMFAWGKNAKLLNLSLLDFSSRETILEIFKKTDEPPFPGKSVLDVMLQEKELFAPFLDSIKRKIITEFLGKEERKKEKMQKTSNEKIEKEAVAEFIREEKKKDEENESENEKEKDNPSVLRSDKKNKKRKRSEKEVEEEDKNKKKRRKKNKEIPKENVEKKKRVKEKEQAGKEENEKNTLDEEKTNTRKEEEEEEKEKGEEEEESEMAIEPTPPIPQPPRKRGRPRKQRTNADLEIISAANFTSDQQSLTPGDERRAMSLIQAFEDAKEIQEKRKEESKKSRRRK
jgi:hypothetical protein